jgi:hypothetical protein
MFKINIASLRIDQAITNVQPVDLAYEYLSASGFYFFVKLALERNGRFCDPGRANGA